MVAEFVRTNRTVCYYELMRRILKLMPFSSLVEPVPDRKTLLEK